MWNTLTHGFCVSAAAVSLVLAAGGAQAVPISNGIASGTLGHWAVDVDGGGQTRDGTLTAIRQDTSTLTTSEIIFDYFTYLKVGSTAFQLSTTGASLVSGEVVSGGTFTGSEGDLITWTSTSSIAPGSSVMTNTFTFTSTGILGALSLFQYLDEDVVGPSDDVFFTRGSAAGKDLQLFTIDAAQAYGVSHSGAFDSSQGLVDAEFEGWAVDNYNDMKSRLGAGTQSVSTLGVFEAGPTATTNPFVTGTVYGPIDIVSVLAWTVSRDARSATIVTTLGGVPDVRDIDDPHDVPEPGALALTALALLAAGAARRRTKR